jgi:hypothetical protein
MEVRLIQRDYNVATGRACCNMIPRFNDDFFTSLGAHATQSKGATSKTSLLCDLRSRLSYECTSSSQVRPEVTATNGFANSTKTDATSRRDLIDRVTRPTTYYFISQSLPSTTFQSRLNFSRASSLVTSSNIQTVS